MPTTMKPRETESAAPEPNWEISTAPDPLEDDADPEGGGAVAPASSRVAGPRTKRTRGTRTWTKEKRRRLVFRAKPRAASRVRLAVQLGTLAVVLVIGVQFVDFVHHLERGSLEGTRPPGVEGFLPISAMISLRQWIETGVIPRVHPAGLVLFCLICLSGLLLKKAFCSWLCPVGTVSEYLARASHRVFRRRIKLPAWIDLPLRSIKYLLLAFFVHAVFFRMTSGVIAQFLDSPYNKVADIKMLYFFTQISPLALKVMAVLVVLSFVVPYFWCRYLCPYGALLGVLSMISPMKVRRSLPDCTQCGKCASVCPSFLPVDQKKVVWSPECTGCLECVAVCPQSRALFVHVPFWRRALRPAVFAGLVVGLFYGGIQAARLAGVWESSVSREELMRRVQDGLDGPQYGHFGR